jgi:hypothetical protein
LEVCRKSIGTSRRKHDPETAKSKIAPSNVQRPVNPFKTLVNNLLLNTPEKRAGVVADASDPNGGRAETGITGPKTIGPAALSVSQVLIARPRSAKVLRYCLQDHRGSKRNKIARRRDGEGAADPA